MATSGETGKAALEGFKDVAGTSCTVFYPLEGVSRVQELQMVTTGGSNTHVIGVRGNFDDAQTGVKRLFASQSFAERMHAMGKTLSSANSINFGRLVPQVVYYFSAYAELLRARKLAAGEPVNFVVPTGNFGNILAGYYARSMGLPVGKLICASNRNNVLTDFFETGIYSTHRTFFKTTSPSMDILISSNLERLLYEAADRDGELIRVWMRQLQECGSYSVGEQRREWLTSVFYAGCANDMETGWGDPGSLPAGSIFNWTPTRLWAAGCCGNTGKRRRTTPPRCCVSTASPYKFAGDVLAALDGKEAVSGLDAFACAERLERLSGVPVPPQVRQLRELPVLHHATTEVEGMAEAALRALGG